MLSSIRRPVLGSTLGGDSLRELVFMLQLVYDDSRNVPVSAGPSSQVAENSLRIRKLESRIAEKKFKCVAAVAVADASKRK